MTILETILNTKSSMLLILLTKYEFVIDNHCVLDSLHLSIK